MNDRQSVLLSVKYWRRFQDYLFRLFIYYIFYKMDRE